MGQVSKTLRTHLETTTSALEKTRARLKGWACHGERTRWFSIVIRVVIEEASSDQDPKEVQEGKRISGRGTARAKNLSNGLAKEIGVGVGAGSG